MSRGALAGGAFLAIVAAATLLAPALPLRDPADQPDGLALRDLPPLSRVEAVRLADGSLRYAREVREAADGGLEILRGSEWERIPADRLGEAPGEGSRFRPLFVLGVLPGLLPARGRHRIARIEDRAREHAGAQGFVGPAFLGADRRFAQPGAQAMVVVDALVKAGLEVETGAPDQGDAGRRGDVHGPAGPVVEPGLVPVGPEECLPWIVARQLHEAVASIAERESRAQLAVPLLLETQCLKASVAGLFCCQPDFPFVIWPCQIGKIQGQGGCTDQ